MLVVLPSSLGKAVLQQKHLAIHEEFERTEEPARLAGVTGQSTFQELDWNKRKST